MIILGVLISIKSRYPDEMNAILKRMRYIVELLVSKKVSDPKAIIRIKISDIDEPTRKMSVWPNDFIPSVFFMISP
jgi:hypothetical protein